MPQLVEVMHVSRRGDNLRITLPKMVGEKLGINPGHFLGFYEEEGRKRGLKEKDLKSFIENNLKLAMDNFEKYEFKSDYESERLVYRAVASSTNERTLISSIIPADTFAGTL